MADLGSAYVNIVPKAPGIGSNIEQVLGGGEAAEGAEKAGKSLGQRLLGGIAALGIGSAVVGVIKSSFEAGAALEQSFGGLETIYGDAAEAAQAYAMQAAAAGISANDYAEQAVSFGAALKQAFGGDTAAAADAANTAIMDMADNAAKMGTDIGALQSAYQGFAKQNYTMLDNLKLGYGGTREEMLRLLADAQAITGVEYNIDNLGDVYEAIHVIQGELGLTGVAAAEASSTFSGSFNAMKASWENVMGALTTGYGLEEAMENLSGSVTAFANNVLRMFGELAPKIPGLITGLADVVIDNAPEFIASGVELIVQLAVGLINAVPKLVDRIPEIFRRVKAAFSQVDWASIGSNIIWGIINGINSMLTNLWNTVSNLATTAWNTAKERLGIASPSKLFAEGVGKWIPLGVAEGIDENLSPVSASVANMADTALSGMSSAAPAGSGGGRSDADRIIAAIQRLRFQVDVGLEGDARGLFKVIRNDNNTVARAATFNPMGGRV